MKKTAALMLSILLIVCAFGFQTFAADSVNVYVTISNGSLALAQKSVNVTDIDADGALTINDALYCAHEQYYDGGASAGYSSVTSDYGLSLTKLWGVENGGSYGYYVNNASAMSLADTVSGGDFINAYVYTDTTAFSDTYCYFNTNFASGSDITLTLSAAGYDENWNSVVLPVAGAVITVNGTDTAFVTADDGSVTVKGVADGSVISARSDSSILIPPVCVASASAAPQTGDALTVMICVSAAALAIGLEVSKRRFSNENR